MMISMNLISLGGVYWGLTFEGDLSPLECIVLTLSFLWKFCGGLIFLRNLTCDVYTELYSDFKMNFLSMMIILNFIALWGILLRANFLWGSISPGMHCLNFILSWEILRGDNYLIFICNSLCHIQHLNLVCCQ